MKTQMANDGLYLSTLSIFIDGTDRIDGIDGTDLLLSTTEAFGLDIGKALTRNEAVLQENG